MIVQKNYVTKNIPNICKTIAKKQLLEMQKTAKPKYYMQISLFMKQTKTNDFFLPSI